MANSALSELAGPSKINLESIEQYSDLVKQVRDNLDGEVERALQDAHTSAQGQARQATLERFWDGFLEIVHANITINGQDIETALQLQHQEVEKYDEKLNKDVMTFQEEVASAVVRNTNERKAVGNRRLHDVRAGLEAARLADNTPEELPAPVIRGGLSDQKSTVYDFHEAMAAAKRVQQTPNAMRYDEVLALESALATVQAQR